MVFLRFDRSCSCSMFDELSLDSAGFYFFLASGSGIDKTGGGSGGEGAGKKRAQIVEVNSYDEVVGIIDELREINTQTIST